MIGMRYEEYGQFDGGLPFVLRTDIRRTLYQFSKEKNWHEDPELQLCTEGCGTVLIGGEQYAFEQGDIAAIGSDVIHYTGTDESLTYSALIISAGFCRQVGIDTDTLHPAPHIRDEKLTALFSELIRTYRDETLPCRTARLYAILLDMLIRLCEFHADIHPAPLPGTHRTAEVKAAIRWIRENYASRVTLDEVARAVCVDKYVLCREFKKFTGQTIIGFCVRFRCMMAADCLAAGYAVAETSRLCGFESPSFFTKTFKKYMGVLPSHYMR